MRSAEASEFFFYQAGKVISLVLFTCLYGVAVSPGCFASVLD